MNLNHPWKTAGKLVAITAATLLSAYFVWTNLSWSSPALHFDSYGSPANGPTVQASPDALNLQTTFAKVAKLSKPAVVSISTVRVQKLQRPNEFFFGDPLNQFFQQFFNQPGAPAPDHPQHF